MIHFGVICPPTPSHVAGMISVSRELAERGHRITFFNLADVEPRVRANGFEFHVIGKESEPLGSLDSFIETMGNLKGVRSIRFGLAAAIRVAKLLVNEVPPVIQAQKIDALLVDQGDPAGSIIAEHCDIPFVTICNAAPMNRDPDLPPTIMPWPYQPSIFNRWRNRISYRIMDCVGSPLTSVINEARLHWRLPKLEDLTESFSPVAQVSQLTEGFDFPNKTRPDHFHYIGLFEKKDVEAGSFPFDVLNGKPMVYVSFGTVVTANSDIYRCIAKACEGLDVQLIITLGTKNRSRSRTFESLPGAPLIVDYAPQMELLHRAAITICHGGANTVLESLACGVPVIAIPVTNDQFGMGARLKRSGAGEMILQHNLNARRLRSLIESVLAHPAYGYAAALQGESIRRAGGSARAADIILRAVSRLSEAH
jgi:zeaxanthin glucosyltransferase